MDEIELFAGVIAHNTDILAGWATSVWETARAILGGYIGRALWEWRERRRKAEEPQTTSEPEKTRKKDRKKGGRKKQKQNQ